MAENNIYRAIYAGPYGSRTASGYVYMVIDPNNEFYDQVMYATEAQPANAMVLLPRSEALYIWSYFNGDVEVVGNFLVMRTEFEGAGQTHVLKLPDGDDVSSVVSCSRQSSSASLTTAGIYVCMCWPHQWLDIHTTSLILTSHRTRHSSWCLDFD